MKHFLHKLFFESKFYVIRKFHTFEDVEKNKK